MRSVIKANGLTLALLALAACGVSAQPGAVSAPPSVSIAAAGQTSPAASAAAAQVAVPSRPASATPEPRPEATGTPQPSATPEPAPEPTAEPTPAPTAEPTAAPTTEPTAAPTATPDVVAGLTIPDLRARTWGAGAIEVGELWNRAPGYTSYRISYPVDGLRLTGLLHVPDGEGPFPVVIANRGYIAPERYQPGMDSRAFADLMARNGYLVLAPDYRGYGGGDAGPNLFYTGYYADVLALIPLAQALPQARPGRVGMWGHSRGASITVAALTISDAIAAAVVYAPAPADLAVDYDRRRRQSNGDPGDETWPFPPQQDPDAYRRVSPINYLDAVGAPVLLHHGSADTTVDASASVAIADALRAAGKDVTLEIYQGSGHALEGAAYDAYAAQTLEFFSRHLTANDER